MDPKQRHDLETNELREFLDNFKDFWDKHGNSILIAFIVVVGGFAVYNWITSAQQAKAEDASLALTGAASPEVLLTVAQDHAPVYDEAMKRAGDQFHARGRELLITGKAEDAKKDFENAANAYQALADKTKRDAYRANAYLGLARVAESRGDWDAAEGFYNQAKDVAGESYTTLAGLAQSGLQTLDTLRHPHPFAENAAPGTGLPDEPVDDGVPDALRAPGESAPGTGLPANPLDSLNPGE